MYSVKDIENAVLEALAPLKSSGLVRVLESYGGAFDEEDITKKTLLMPAVYVIWSGSELEGGNLTDAIVARVSVIFCARSLRGEGAVRRGAPEATGIYQIMDAARELVHRKPILKGWSVAFLEREGPLAYTHEGGLAIYEQIYLLRARA
jgi:phage gp37-like protein